MPDNGVTANLPDQLLDLLPRLSTSARPTARFSVSTDAPLSFGAARPCSAIRETASAAPIACTDRTAICFRTTNVPWRTSCVTAFRS